MRKQRYQILIDYCVLYDKLQQEYPDAWQDDDFCDDISRVIHSTYQDWCDSGYTDQQFYRTFVETDLIAWMIFHLDDLSPKLGDMADNFSENPEDLEEPEPTKQELKLMDFLKNLDDDDTDVLAAIKKRQGK